MKGQQIRLIIILSIGVVAVFVAKPIMTQVMLFQENQKAKVVTPPPDYVPPIDASGVSMEDRGGADSEADTEAESKAESKSETEESKTEDKPATDGK